MRHGAAVFTTPGYIYPAARRYCIYSYCSEWPPIPVGSEVRSVLRHRYASTTATPSRYIYCGYVGAPLDTSLWCQVEKVETIMIARDHNIHPYCPPTAHSTRQYIAVEVYNLLRILDSELDEDTDGSRHDILTYIQSTYSQPFLSYSFPPPPTLLTRKPCRGACTRTVSPPAVLDSITTSLAHNLTKLPLSL